MIDVNASDAKRHFEEWHDKALIEPVAVAQGGRRSVVLLSAQTYERLIKHYREVVDTAKMDEAMANSIMRSEIAPENVWHLD